MDITTPISHEPYNTPDLIKNESVRFSHLTNEVSKIIVGQENILHFINLALLCNGHILLEGVPGVAKTTMIKAVTAALGLSFKRIQFTPDLLPADLIGTLIYNQKTQDFETKKGPLFANLILADEINRAPAKVQAALLEAMQEHQVTIGSQTFFLEEPFLVFATQNPIENEGTYRLPEAQVDRFMFKLIVHYQNKEQERKIVEARPAINTLQHILSGTDIMHMQQLVHSIYIDSKIIDYIINIVFATRNPQEHNLQEIQSYIKYGVSPRATLALHHASKAHAFLKGRHFVTPDDVKTVCAPILRHRILLSYHAEAENVTTETIIKKILHTIPSP